MHNPDLPPDPDSVTAPDEAGWTLVTMRSATDFRHLISAANNPSNVPRTFD